MSGWGARNARVAGGAGRLRTARLSRGARTWIAGGISIALLSTIAVIANGYDAREVHRAEPGVWVERDAGQYARVNTDTGELDIVRKVTEPSDLVQAGAHAVVFSHGNGRAWPIASANPVDFGDAGQGDAGQSGAGQSGAAENDGAQTSAADPTVIDSAGSDSARSDSSGQDPAGTDSVRMPEGTRDVVSAGRFVGVRTEAGSVYIGELAETDGTLTVPSGLPAGADLAGQDLAARLESLRSIDPLRDETETQREPGDAAAATAAATAATAAESAVVTPVAGEARGYRADAIAVAADGSFVLYSAEEGAMRRFDAVGGEFVGGAQMLPEIARQAVDPQLALISGRWVLLDAESGLLTREGADELQLDLTGTGRLQASGGDAGGTVAVHVADADGLWRISPGEAAVRVAEARGAPAQPIEVGGQIFGAWLGQNGGSLWSHDRLVSLQFDDSVREAGELIPVFRSNGARAVLSEGRTGMLWTLPDGAMIPLSQWTISDPPKEDRGAVVVDEVTEPIAPTAVNDAFGVRPGQPSPLSVMLNDFDANTRDVLTIVPDSLGESPLPESFGTLQLLPDGQQLMVQPAMGATGTASFRYRVTDGTLTSEAATVTLTAIDDQTNTAPEWCPVEGCQREWRVPAMAPGGTLVYPLLDDWVDPEGDVSVLAAVERVRPEDPVRAIVTADGRLAVRHTDANAGAAEVPLRLTVRDGGGEERLRELVVSVQPDAPAEFLASASSVQVGKPTVLRPLLRVAGGSGSYALIDATLQSGDNLRVTPQSAAGTVEIEAAAVGSSTLTLSMRDTLTGGEITGTVRVTATPSGPSLVLPPLRAFVRPLSDSTVEILDAIPGADARALTVSNTVVVDGEMRADVIEHSRVRVAGNTADGGPGRMGAVDVTIAEGDARGTGRLTVFQVPEAGSSDAIAVSDSATVRAGSFVDIRVLDNDIVAPGERLLLYPEVRGSGTAGELAFASGSVLRYLAPQTPGTYRLGYTIYSASAPEASDVGAVLVTVLPAGANRDPQPRLLTARVAPGEQAEVRVPLSGVDPDGDRIRLVSVASPDDTQVSTSVSTTGSTLIVAASADAQPRTHEVDYAVRDDAGGTGAGTLRVIVTPEIDGGSPPIAGTDYLRLVPGTNEPAVVLPLENDIDPALGTLSIVSVTPNVAGGPESPEYQRLMARLDLSALAEGRVGVRSGAELGTVSFRYTVRSSATTSTADGLIVVQTSERVGVQAPTVSDTVLNVRDRATLASTGVDVLTDKVSWSAGEVSSLKLSLWEKNANEYRVEGNRVIGAYDPAGDLVVFRLTGVDVTGAEVSTYGFLVIPPLDELRLTLKAGFTSLSVAEGKSVEANIRGIVDVGPGDRVELRSGDFRVSRPQAVCSSASGEALRYVASTDGPWADTCLVEVRLVGQTAWTSLAVPVIIVPDDPIVLLKPLTRTIAPGASETIQLADMISWQGGREGDRRKLRFETSGGGSLFEVLPDGVSVKATARADAVPGAQEGLTVSVSGAGESRAPLTLRVGEAARDVPKGGTVGLSCTVGAACTATVVGVPGEYDPFAAKTGGGLKLDAVRGDSCQVASFARTDDRSLAVSWPADRVVGGTCTVSFSVRDAQGRTGEGSIEFDAQGLPDTPSSIIQSGFTATTATFEVILGGQQARPSVTGVTLSGAGSSRCESTGPSSYQCVASGLENGARSNFAARAVNGVGESAPSTLVQGWAYTPPALPTAVAAPLANPDNESQASGAAELTVSGSNDTQQFKILVNGVSAGVIGEGGGTRSFPGLPIGRNVFTVTPVSRFEVPLTGGASVEGAAREVPVTVIGAPLLEKPILISVFDSTAASVTPQITEYRPGESVEFTYAVARANQQMPACSPGNGTFSGLTKNSLYQAQICARSQYGTSVARSEPIPIGGALAAPTVSYTIAQNAAADGSGGVVYGLVGGQPTIVQDPAATLTFSNTGSAAFDVAGQENLAPITVVQCIEDACSEASPVTWSNAPRIVTVQPNGSCAVPGMSAEQLRGLISVTGAKAENATVSIPVAPAPGATSATLRIDWGAPFGLNAADLPVCYAAPAGP